MSASARALEDWIDVAFVEPRDKRLHVRRNAIRARRFIMDLFATHRSRCDPHGAVVVIPICACPDLADPGSACREKRCLPAEKPLVGQGGRAVFRRGEHHLYDAFNVPIRRHETADIDPEPARYRRPDCVEVEIFALNLTRVVDCGGQRRKFRLFLYFEADRRHEPAYVACRLPCPRKARSYGRFIPGEIRPVSVLPDIPHVLKIRPLAEINPRSSAWH